MWNPSLKIEYSKISSYQKQTFMDNSFKTTFEAICKIQRKWDDVNVVLKSNLPSSNYQVDTIGPFAFFTTEDSSEYDFILFMPDFSPLNQETNKIILQPNNSENNLYYTLTFNDENCMNSFLKYWYDSLILVEDMLRAIVLKKHTQSETILTYNRTAKTFQKVMCVIQAISSMVVFQTQFFNEISMIPGVSIEIDKEFISGIVSPINTFIQPDKKLFSFYIESNKHKNKLYFVCPNKESLMQWILILHGLSCQTKYTENAIDEEHRYLNFIEKVNKMIGDIKDDDTKSQEIKERSVSDFPEEEESEIQDSEKEELSVKNKQESIENNYAAIYSKIFIIFFSILAFIYFKSFC